MKRNRPKLRWNEHCHHPFESVWSILHKLSHWNSLTPYDLEKLFWDPLKKNASEVVAQNASSWSPYSVDRVGKTLGIPDANLLLAEVDPYRFELTDSKFEEPSSSKQTLRYCPKCISLGFHSARFQMPWIRIFPIHRVELVYGCPSCDAHIPYRCDLETLTFAY